MKRIKVFALAILVSHCAFQTTAFSADQSGYEKYAATAGIAADRLVVWNSPDEKRNSLQTEREKDEFTSLQIDKDTKFSDEQKKMILATLNKGVEAMYARKIAPFTPPPKGEYEKTADYEQRIAAERAKYEANSGQPERVKVAIINSVISALLDTPRIANEKYDADREILTFNIVQKDSYSADPKVKIPVAMNLTGQQARSLSEYSGWLRPTILFEFANNALTAKYLVFNTESPEILKELRSVVSKGVPLNFKLNQTFGTANLAAYNTDIKTLKAADTKERDARMKTKSWYPIYARFLDSPSQCEYLKNEIRLAGSMNGSDAAGQAKTVNYANSIASQYPKCMK